MSTNQNNTWKSYVDWWPTYIMIGISLAYFVDQTGIVQKLSRKLLNTKGKERSTDEQEEY